MRVLLTLLALFSAHQSEVSSPPGEIELRVELRQAGRWQPVDVHTVFKNKDEIRFTFKTSFAGYLKVVNKTSDGDTSSLFPFSDTKQMGRVEAGSAYVIPDVKGSFVVGGKPGFDLTEWVVSSVPLDGDWQPAATLPKEPSSLLPKCPPDGLQPRRTCLDSRAGPAPNTTPDQPLVSRDLDFHSRDLSALISVPDTSRKLVVYEFRVAHR